MPGGVDGALPYRAHRVMDTRPVIVIGSGIVGIMTAAALAMDGRKVTVIGREDGPAELTSRANAGVISAGHAEAWAGPGAPLQIVRAVAGHEPGIIVSNLSDPGLWRWGLQFLAQSTARAHRRNSDRLARLAAYSRRLFLTIERELDLSPELSHEGCLYLFQDKNAFARAAAHASSSETDVLPGDALIAREPVLSRLSNTLSGGLYARGDTSGDCHRFAGRVAARIAELHGVAFLAGSAVTGFRHDGRRILAVRTGASELECSAAVLATGPQTVELTAPLGFRPAIYPVKGYSGTWPILDHAGVCTLPFIDETNRIAVASYGGHVRITAFAEFAGRDRSIPAERIAVLKRFALRLFGDAIDHEAAWFWTGHRPVTPGGPPFLGRIRRYENLWINAGHGTLGWTMSAGCARILADAMAGSVPVIGDVSSHARWLEPL